MENGGKKEEEEKEVEMVGKRMREVERRGIRKRRKICERKKEEEAEEVVDGAN